MHSHNLPTQLTTFIGREHEIAEARRLLATARLLTLTGSGGSGKTRLVLAVAEVVLEEFPDGVWMVELAPLSDPALIPQTIASALGVRETPGQPWLETLAAFLKSKRLLLVLDNCEHLIEPCAMLAYALLTACPDLCLLATSREPLHIAGEVTWLVPGLILPSLQNLPPADQLAQVEAVRLFLDRARRVFPAFTLTEQNSASVAQICCRLGGTPLAIELAAARLRVLSPEQIADRLDDVLRLLVSSDRTAPSRHQTLQAALDWSHTLLQEPEQALFRRLAVFAGGASLEAVEMVCADEGFQPEGEKGAPAAPVVLREQILDLLGQLVEKSLVTVEREPGARQRYRLLEPVRQYALRKLEAAGEESALRNRHLAWFLGLAEEMHDGIGGPQPQIAVKRLDEEYPNLRAALDWSMEHPDKVSQAYRLTDALTQYWQLKGYFSEGVKQFKTLFASPAAAPDSLGAAALASAAFLYIHVGDLDQAQDCILDALALREAEGSRNEAAWLRGRLGWIAMVRGNLEEAFRLGDEALKAHQEHEDLKGLVVVFFLLGDLAFLQGDIFQARTYHTETLRLSRENGLALMIVRRLVRMGQISLALHDYGQVESYLAEGLHLSQETGDQWGIAMGLAGMAGLARRLDQPERAAQLLGATQALLNSFGTHLWPLDRQEYERNLSTVRQELGEQAFEAAWEAGLKLGNGPLDPIMEFVLSPTDLELQEAAAGRHDPAPQPLTPLQAAKSEFGGLTRREREVAILIAQGKSNAEIAAALFVGLRTVEAHVTHILNRLGFTSRTQIAGWAVEKGLADSPTGAMRAA